MIDDLRERAELEPRRLDRVLVLGIAPGSGLDHVAAQVDRLELGQELELAQRLSTYDAIFCLGLLDTSDQVELLVTMMRQALRPDGVFLAAFPGNDTLPVLRQATILADQACGRGTAARTHPRIAAASIPALLGSAGFGSVVVDVDRMRLRYRSFAALVADLRDAAATNVLAERPKHPNPCFAPALAAAYAALGDEQGTLETIEIVHVFARAGQG
ncbi:hypothetical protein HMF7854_14175 [Sphingomonas ginkgonis]|uniref:Methyltransferase n=1 Tax=Sphingomonas ginkgonis TaxID=2315330 RepID=A0A429VCV5_9SPHN|nr:hypothetical protein [Sphingomonas ginkgonis]RST31855.1 hypothetical protein HMF7854_14175 [Sphingomonas ginkgonis]